MNYKDCFHLKEHDEGIGDGKADAEDEYEEIDDEHLRVAQDHRIQKWRGAVIIMTYVCYFHPVTVIAADHCHNSYMHLHNKNASHKCERKI